MFAFSLNNQSLTNVQHHAEYSNQQRIPLNLYMAQGKIFRINQKSQAQDFNHEDDKLRHMRNDQSIRRTVS